MPACLAPPRALCEALRGSQHALILTGSGISAESGVPTFRDAQRGLWAQYDPLQLATPGAFAADPALVWRWYRWRRELVAAAVPNAAHIALARLASLLPRLTLVTQNVDGLHQHAGSPGVIEYHGNLFRDACEAGCRDAHPAERDAEVPSCRACGARLRPGVVWFGEAVPVAAADAAHRASMDCDLFMSIGTSSLVWPAAGLAVNARECGAQIVEINPEATPLSGSVDFRLRGKAGDWLPELLNCFVNA